MRDAQPQAQAAVAQQAAYVTVLMGANDLCTGAVSTMTSPDTFRTQFTAAMDTLAAGLPAGSHVFVSSIPNVYLLYQLFKDNGTARFVWTVTGICQSLLSPFNTEADRQAVVEREQQFNAILGEVCGRYPFCLFDGNATYNYAFTSSDVSKLDYFHPSLAGQAKLAQLT